MGDADPPRTWRAAFRAADAPSAFGSLSQYDASLRGVVSGAEGPAGSSCAYEPHSSYPIEMSCGSETRVAVWTNASSGEHKRISSETLLKDREGWASVVRCPIVPPSESGGWHSLGRRTCVGSPREGNSRLMSSLTCLCGIAGLFTREVEGSCSAIFGGLDDA